MPCVLPRVPRRRASVRSTTPSTPIFLSGKGEQISCFIAFRLPCLGIKYNVCLILPPYIHASQINPNNHVPHIPENHVLLCYYCSLLSPCLVFMLRMLRMLPPITLWIGLSHYYIIVVDDMIIIMLTIFDEGWKV